MLQSPITLGIFAAKIVYLIFVGWAANAAESDSVSLPSGFTPTAENSPPTHEAYSMGLEDTDHLIVVSIDRRPIQDAYDFIEEKGKQSVGPIAAGHVAIEIGAIKQLLDKPRPGWSVKHEIGSIASDALPYRYCDGFEWEAVFSPTERVPKEESWTMHGQTVTCFFLGKETAWMTSATVSENIHPSKGQSLSQGFDELAKGVLSSLRY